MKQITLDFSLVRVISRFSLALHSAAQFLLSHPCLALHGDAPRRRPLTDAPKR
ncbi:Protein kinase domain-containing protein [Psidium guajava]|nr:Protein kinase domain-containing protein [Psidium guajava]